jgi:CIC family chloride channel protein
LIRELLDHVVSLRSSAKWLLLSTLVGIVAGCGGIVFQVTEQAIFRVASQGTAGFSPKEAEGERRLYSDPGVPMSPARLLLVLAAGGAAAGLLVQLFAPEAGGHGTDAAIEAYHHKRGYIRPIVPIVKLLASAITIGTGGSGGREGPIAQIGAGFGSSLGAWLKLSSRDRRILLAAGMGAGVGAIFRAPLAGALFAAEILYRDADLETEVIVPAAVSSIVGYTVFSFWLPPHMRFLPLFGDGLHHELDSLLELAPMAILAFVLVAVAVLYIKIFYGIHGLAKSIPLPPFMRPVVGAVAAGLLGLGLYYAWNQDRHALAVLGTGYGTLQETLADPSAVGMGLLLCIAFFKILTTSATIGLGGSGGVFGPSMVIGGCTGGAVGELLHGIWPTLVPQPAIYAVVGMAGFFAGCAHAPISTIVMVSELTGDYSLLAPTMWVSTLCFILCRRWTLYEKQLPTRLDSPAHRGDFLVDVLEGIKIKDVPWKVRQTVPEGTSLEDIMHLLAESRQHYFPVVDNDGRFVGIFSTDDVRSYLFNKLIWELANARDVMTARVVSVTPEDDLNTALVRFTELNLDELPVVAAGRPSELLGMLRRKDVIFCYNQRLSSLQRAAREHAACRRRYFFSRFSKASTRPLPAGAENSLGRSLPACPRQTLRASSPNS